MLHYVSAEENYLQYLPNKISAHGGFISQTFEGILIYTQVFG